MKEVEMMKYEIEYRGLSGPTALFVICGHSELQLIDENSVFKWFDKEKVEKKDSEI